MNQIAVGVITGSDRAFQAVCEDLGGSALREAATRCGWQILAEAIVTSTEFGKRCRSFPAKGCALILTTGGPDAALRDVTPEAVRSMMRSELSGFGDVMRAGSLKLTPNAILSPSLAAIVDRSLVIALPGKPQGAVDCLGFVAGAIPHSTAIAQQMPTVC
jgi:molybdopterin adenylyltransferase